MEAHDRRSGERARNCKPSSSAKRFGSQPHGSKARTTASGAATSSGG